MLPPVVVEGDSTALQMRPALERRLPVGLYDARGFRSASVGVARLTARRVQRRPTLVILGTVDAVVAAYGAPVTTASDMAHLARIVLRASPCVVWGLVRVRYGDGGAAINRGLRSVRRLHLVRPVEPGSDGVHLSPAGIRVRSARFARVTRRACG